MDFVIENSLKISFCILFTDQRYWKELLLELKAMGIKCLELIGFLQHHCVLFRVHVKLP